MSRVTRIHVDKPLTPGTELRLPANAAHHLLRVLRCKTGDSVTLFNGDGFDYYATIKASGKNTAAAAIFDRGTVEPSPPVSIHLGLGISKGQRMDTAIQKAVELGVKEITPLNCTRSVVRLSPNKEETRRQHWQQIVISACEQSGRCRIPRVHSPQSLDTWKMNQKVYGIVLDPLAENVISSLEKPAETLYLASGPEGGLADDEIDLLLKRGFQSIQLGPRVLRTETAPLAANAAIQAIWGDFR